MGADNFIQFVIDQLESLGGVEARRMFGGHGFYLQDTFFAIAWKGHLYFKTDESTRGPYQQAGMGPFQPSETQMLGNYFEVPLDVLEDPKELTRWARAAVDVARRGKAAPKPGPRKSPSRPRRKT